MPSIQCSEHKDWQMKRAPTSTCDLCNGIWDLIKLGAKVIK
jgi:hypothetical protein